MERGCPLAIIGNELTEKDDAIRQALSIVFNTLTKRMTTFFIEQKKDGHLPKNAKAEQYARWRELRRIQEASEKKTGAARKTQ